MAFGSEDVQHLFKLDSNLVELSTSKCSIPGRSSWFCRTATSPIVPVINQPVITYGGNLNNLSSVEVLGFLMN